MHLISFITFTLLCSCSFFFPVLSLQCSAKQYSWPGDKHEFCCNKCPPGQYMTGRNPKTCDTQCEPCTGKRYTDTYNVGMNCKVCENCDKANMEYVSLCNSTHNAVCRCKAGYRCEDEACTYCKPAPPTTTTLSPSTTVLRHETLPTLRVSTNPLKDSVWFLVIISLLCVGIALVIATKIKPVLNWFTYNKGYCLARKPLAPAPVCTEDDGVCKPVQEMCGKCDQPIEV